MSLWGEEQWVELTTFWHGEIQMELISKTYHSGQNHDQLGDYIGCFV